MRRTRWRLGTAALDVEIDESAGMQAGPDRRVLVAGVERDRADVGEQPGRRDRVRVGSSMATSLRLASPIDVNRDSPYHRQSWSGRRPRSSMRSAAANASATNR